MWEPCVRSLKQLPRAACQAAAVTKIINVHVDAFWAEGALLSLDLKGLRSSKGSQAKRVFSDGPR